jgi:hypothetical protein
MSNFVFAPSRILSLYDVLCTELPFVHKHVRGNWVISYVQLTRSIKIWREIFIVYMQRENEAYQHTNFLSIMDDNNKNITILFF